jgi:hypothetical protein
MQTKTERAIMIHLVIVCLLLLGCGGDTSGDWFGRHPTAKAMEDAQKWAEKENFEYDSMNCGYSGADVQCEIEPKNPLPRTVLKCTKLGCEREGEKQ